MQQKPSHKKHKRHKSTNQVRVEISTLTSFIPLVPFVILVLLVALIEACEPAAVVVSFAFEPRAEVDGRSGTRGDDLIEFAQQFQF
jgi:hypothetical protein